MLHAVVMSGGSGTRFWPQSRRDRPKQLQPLAGETSLLQQAFDRLEGLVPADRTWIVTNTLQAEATRQQLPAVAPERVLEEPRGRNTAPCVGLAACHLLAIDPDAVMLVMPADHVIGPHETFRAAVGRATELVSADSRRLVLFGVPPNRPATGYGYIRRGDPLGGDHQGHHVAAFHEKPDRATAENYITTGETYWNCGIFTWRADRILEALAEHQPELAVGLEQIGAAVGTDDYRRVLESAYDSISPISIDHAVLEHSDDACLIEAPFDWHDVGSWHALSQLSENDPDGNTLRGRVTVVDSSNCIVRSDGDHLVAAVGVEGLVIVHTADATLVARRDDEEGLRRLVERLEEEGRGDCL
jgi:mannose-1-phosphate guanylyltransferase